MPDLTVAQNLRLTGGHPGAVRGTCERSSSTSTSASSSSDVPLPLLRMLDLARALARDPAAPAARRDHRRAPADLAERVFDVMRAPAGARPLGALHHPPPRGGDRHLRPGDGPARRRRTSARSIPQEGGEEQIVELMLGPEAARAVGGRRRDPSGGRAARRRRPTARPRSRSAGSGRRGLDGRLLRAPAGRGARDRRARGPGPGRALRRALRRPHGRRRRDPRRRQALRARHPYDAIRAGVVLVPADRLQALLPQRSVRENIAAAALNRVGRWGPINMRDERRRVQRRDRRAVDRHARRRARCAASPAATSRR